MSHRAFAASTLYPNSPETDLQAKVWHTVTVEFDKAIVNILHYSSDPMTAIDEVNRMPKERVQKLIIAPANGARKER